MAEISTVSVEDVAQIDQEFRNVAALADRAEKNDTKTGKLLAESLDAMFEFGQQLRQNEQAMSAFFASKPIKLNKATRENPYNGLVKLAFANTKKPAMLSKYARALHYAHDSRMNGSIKDWITTNGIEACYKTAAEHFRPSQKENKEAARHLRIASGKAKLDSLSLSGAFDLTETLEPGYVRAILRIDGSGQTAEVASIVETGHAEWNEIFARFASAQTSRHQALMGNPLFPVFRAVEIIRAFAPENDKTGHVLIRNLADAGRKTSVIEFVSQAPAFRSARMILAASLDLPDSCSVLATLGDAASFVQAYPTASDWTISENALASSRLRIALSRLEDSQLALRAARFEGHKRHHFLMPADVLDAATKPGVLEAKTSPSKPKSPDRLALDANGNTLSIRNISLLGASFPLFETQAPASPVADDRFLPLRDLTALASAILPYQVDLDGCFLSYSAPDEALLLNRDFGGDRLELVIPMVVDAKLHTTFEYDKLRP